MRSTCWQHDIREKTLEEDIKTLGISPEEIKIEDFSIEHVPLDNRDLIKQAQEFILRYEWLGSIPQRSTNYFIARFKGVIGGVLIYTYPNSFTKKLGEYSKNHERLLARGACAGWTPKGLASFFIMKSVRWLAKTKDIKFFTAYSDIEAGEIGTIYQACNFYYLGNSFGSKMLYKITRKNGQEGWVNQRYFNKKRNYKKYLKELGVAWTHEWDNGTYGIAWGSIPGEIAKAMKEEGKKRMDACEKRVPKQKHKYMYVLGKDARDTDFFRKLVEDKLKPLERYPKRGEEPLKPVRERTVKSSNVTEVI